MKANEAPEKYISKSDLVAEIEKWLEETDKGFPNDHNLGRYDMCKQILSLLDTLEVKEVELTWKDIKEICTQSVLVEIDLGGLVSDERHYTEVLKRFKAQKRE